MRLPGGSAGKSFPSLPFGLSLKHKGPPPHPPKVFQLPSKAQWVRVCGVSSVASDSVTLWTVALPGSSVPGILQARILEWVAMPSSGDLHDPGIKPASLCLLHWQMGSLPLASPGKPLGAHIYQLSPLEQLLLVFLDPQSWPGLPRHLLTQLPWPGGLGPAEMCTCQDSPEKQDQ